METIASNKRFQDLHFDSIQALRGLAALFVVFQHDRITVKHKNRRKHPAYRRLPGGDQWSAYLNCPYQNDQECTADQAAVLHADMKGNEK